MNKNDTSRRAIIIWLGLVCALILAMVVVGGVTRLTDSGLSMVDWKPIMGVIPPLNDQQWSATFEKYQQYPEYIKVNHAMSIDEFKSIFYWEYGHRLLGRVIGIVFLLPFLVFWLTGRLSGSLRTRLLWAFIIGGLQGLMGWYMVMSGLVDKPNVSHYRLTAHLGLALFLLVYLFWIILDLRSNRPGAVDGSPAPPGIRGLALVTTTAVCLQIVYGAFTAGLHAGWGYNTFPSMNGHWMADAVGALTPFWLNFLESTATIQFIHRWLGTLVLALAVWLWSSMFRSQLDKTQRLSLHMLAVAVCGQYVLGVYTLVKVVPLVPAALHQAGACLVLLAMFNVNFRFRRRLAPQSPEPNGNPLHLSGDGRD